MERGKRLEGEVLKEVEKKTKQKFKRSGLILHPSLPIFGASPDGINETSVVEIKISIHRQVKEELHQIIWRIIR